MANQGRRASIVLGLILLVAILAWENRRPVVPRPVPAPVLPVQPIPTGSLPEVTPRRVPSRRLPPKKSTKKDRLFVVPASPAPVSTPDLSVSAEPQPVPGPREWWGNADTAITHSGQIVITSDNQWTRFWAEHHPHEASPEVDFSRDMVVGVFLGPRPADAFAVHIIDAQLTAATLVVHYREEVPPPGTLAINVRVYPYHLKAIPRTNLPVKFAKVG